MKRVRKAVTALPGGSELGYVDGLGLMIRDGKEVLAVEIPDGRYFDTGNKLEYLKTVVEFGLRHAEVGGDFRRWIRGIV